MDQKLSYKEYVALVEKQAQDIVDKLAFAATGDLDTVIDVPEGIEPLTDLAIGISYLLDDMQALLAEQVEMKGKLEEAVADKTADLASTLADLQAAQQRYTQQAWHHYTTQREQEASAQSDLDEPWLLAMAEAVEQKETVAYGGDAARVAIPVEYSDTLIGVLGFASDEVDQWDEEELLAVEGIVEQVGLALENQRLIDQTQQQLAELATINEIAEATSNLLSMDALLPALGELLQKAFNTWGVSIAIVDQEAQKVTFPYYQFTGLDDVKFPDVALDEPSLTTRIIRSQEPVLLITEDVVSRKEEQIRSVGIEPASFLGVPLLVGQRVVGVISLQRLDDLPPFTEADQRLMMTISRNVSVALENARLFEETQERAEQLELLSKIETALSVAETDDEIVTAVLEHLDCAKVKNSSLAFLHDTGYEVHMDMMSFWQEGQFLSIDPSDMHGMASNKIPGFSIWREQPGQTIFITDLEQDAAEDTQLAKLAKEQGWQSIALLPLRSGRNWQGLFAISWAEKHAVTRVERFVFQRLMEPLSAIVASRRARLAQQAALEEMESLYEASALLNVSQGYDDILNVLRDYSVFGDNPIFISLSYFNRPWQEDSKPESVAVLARFETVKTPDLSREYRLDQFPSMYNLLSRTNAVVVPDISVDDRVTEWFRDYFINSVGARSALFVPLVVGQQWVGFVTAFYPDIQRFSNQQLRRPMALAGQAAVATQSLRLLKMAQQRAQREQILREVTERVRNATDIDLIMKTAVQEVSRALGRPAYIKLETNEN